MPDFLPRRDSEIASFTGRFADQLAIDREQFGISEQRLSDYVALRDAFMELYRTTASRANRSMTIVAAKDSKRSELIEATRSIAWTVRSHASATDEQLVALGLRPKTRARRKIPTPVDAPIVRVNAIDGRRVCVRLADVNRPASRARPRDVNTAFIYTSIGEHEPVDETGWRWTRATSKTTNELMFTDTAPAGTKIWFTACWQGPRGTIGPRSKPVSVRLMFDGPIMAGKSAA